MKKKRYLFPLFILPLLLVSSCNNNEEKDEILSVFNSIEKSFSKIKDDVTYKNYSQKQIDNYGALDIESQQVGEAKLYDGDFLKDNFTQTISDTNIEGTSEKGICEYQNKEVFYSINYYPSSVDNSSVKYYEYDKNLKEKFFEISFKAHYLNLMDIAKGYYESNQGKGYVFSLSSSIKEIDLKKDGEKTFNFDFKIISHSSGELLEIKSEDKIFVDKGLITASLSNYYYSLQGGLNYKAVALSATYSKLNNGLYNGDKLNPNNF